MDKNKYDDCVTFIKRYFNSSYIKRCIMWAVLFLIIVMLTKTVDKTIAIVIAACISRNIILLIIPSQLQRETQESAKQFFNSYSVKNDEAIFFCNIKKFNGPTFGILHVKRGSIVFEVFRENLKNEGFEINTRECVNFRIEVEDNRLAFIDRLISRQLYEIIAISYDNKTIKLQTINTQKNIQIIKNSLTI